MKQAKIAIIQIINMRNDNTNKEFEQYIREKPFNVAKIEKMIKSVTLNGFLSLTKNPKET